MQTARNIMKFPEKNRYKPETAAAFIDMFRADESLQDGPVWLKSCVIVLWPGWSRAGYPLPGWNAGDIRV